MNDIDKDLFRKSLIKAVLDSLFYLFVIVSSIWLCLALWIHQPFGKIFTYLAIALWLTLAGSITGIYFVQAIFKRKTDVLIYLICFSIGVICFLAMPPRNDRDWNPEVARILDYQKDGDIVTLHNVRNFNWRAEDDYDIHWDTRQYDLSKLENLDVVLSYWAGNKIAHTLVSFGFSDGRHLSFSLEIRKEKTEEFSTIGGFFRQYELALVAADEKDIIYTRSNIRDERVYLYPVKISKPALQKLFVSYLKKGKALQQQPRWYNTVFSNCTTIIFDMVNAIHPLPADYRLIVSGMLPDYLYDIHALDQHYTLASWYQMAFINPKVKGFEARTNQSSALYSALIRQGLPLNAAP